MRSRGKKSKEIFEQEVGGDLSVCVLNLLLKASNLLSLVAISLITWKYKFFKLSHDLSLITWQEDSMVGVSNNKSTHCLVWCPRVLCNLIRWLKGQVTTWIGFFGWMVLFCRVLLQNNMTKGSGIIMGRSASRLVIILLRLVVIGTVIVEI